MLMLLLGTLLIAAPQVDDDMLPASYQPTIRHASASSDGAGGGVLGRSSNGSVLGIDSLPNFSSYFYEPGLVDNGSFVFPQWTWPYTMVGRAPFGQDDDSSHHTTVINAPIIPVIVDLRNFDGSPRFFTFPDGTKGPRMILDATQYVNAVLQSPVFSNASYDSSERPTQFTDAIHRAQFFRQSEDDWHTILRPSVKATRTVVLIRGTYRFGAYADGTLRYILVDENVFNSALFPPTGDDTATLIGGAEHAGDMKTTDMTSFLFPNTFLYQGTPANCCVLGFHSYDVEAGDAANGFREKHYVMNYSSWISPGIFGGGFQDVTALSHELMETFSDPFVNDATPIWLAPNGNCQANLESGDGIEGLPNAVYPVRLTPAGLVPGACTSTDLFCYHPQNEQLLQWFAGETPSSAIHHAYSYPDITVLTSAAVPQAPGCSGPANVARTR